MAKREIEEADFEVLTRLKGMLDTLYTDPEVGMEMKRLIKRKFPKAAIPEIDVAAPYEKRLEGIEKAIDDIKGLFGSARKSWDDDKAAVAVKDEFGFTGDGMDRVRKIAEEQKLPLRAAAALMVHDQPPAPVAPTGLNGSGRWDLFGPSGDKAADDDLQSLIKDPDGWLDRAIPKVLAEVKTGRKLPVGV